MIHFHPRSHSISQSINLSFNQPFNHLFPRRKETCRPLDVPSLLADSIRSQPVDGRLDPSSPVYWKLVISLPEGCKDLEFTDNDNSGLKMSFVIKEKFKRGVYPLHNNSPQGLRKKVSLSINAEILHFNQLQWITKLFKLFMQWSSCTFHVCMYDKSSQYFVVQEITSFPCQRKCLWKELSYASWMQLSLAMYKIALKSMENLK